MDRAMRAVVLTAVTACAGMGCGGNAVVDVATGGSGGLAAQQGGNGGSGGAGGTTGCEVAECFETDHATTIIAKNQVEPNGIAVDKEGVYWANTGDELDPPSRAIMRADLAGGPVVKLAEEPKFPAEVALDDQFIYWTSAGEYIQRAPKSGGEAEIVYQYLASAWSLAIVVDASYLYVTDLNDDAVLRIATKTPGDVTKVAAGDRPHALTADDAHLYWSVTKGLMKASKGDLTPALLHKSDSGNGERVVAQIAVDEERVYFSTWLAAGECGGEATILSMLKDGGDLVTVVGTEHRIGNGPMAVDDSFVYWADYYGGRIMKVPKTGGAPLIVACGQDKPRGLAIDASFVYWTTEGGGTVVKALK